MSARTRPACRILAAAAILVGCGGTSELQYERALERTASSAAHGVHQERLISSMRELDRLRGQRLPQALDIEQMEARQAQQVARVARAMAVSAKAISAAAPSRLDPQQEALFRELAATLEGLCNGLASEAPRLSARERAERLAEIDATCDGCHRRFRIPGIVHGGD